MRPLRLEFSAFGPYPDEQRLDFDRLPDGTLFLVHGPTGSGKTTILDAMCFALYGDTSGAEREGGDMRCQIAAVDTLTEIRLDFALGAERFRVRRVPEQLRPKRSGKGLTEQKKDATLWSLAEDGTEGKPLATGWSKVTRALQDRIGLDSAQFRQVVLLPQGQFRKLLTAGSTERQAILERLFDTKRFRQLEEDLKARVSKMRAASDELTTREHEIASQAARTLGRDEAGGPTALNEAEAALVEEIGAAATLAETAKTQAAADAKALQTGEAAQRTLTELEAARNHEAQVSERKPAKQVLREELRFAERASRAEPAIQRRVRAVSGCVEVAQDLDEALLAETTAIEGADLATKDLDQETTPEADGAREQAAREVSRFQNLREAVGELVGARAEAKAAGESLTRAEEAVEEAKKAVAAVEGRRDVTEAERASAAQQAGGEAELATALEKARTLEKDARQLAELVEAEESALAVARVAAEERVGTEEALAEARADAEEIRLGFESGQAARLAAKLTGGDPCPVCGATEHPALAQAGDGVPSEEQLEAAEGRVAEALAAREAKSAAATAAEATAKAKSGEVERQARRVSREDAANVEVLAEQTRAARTALQQAEAARVSEQQAVKALARIDEDLEAARHGTETARTASEQAGRDAAAAAGRLSTHEANVPEGLRAPGQLQAASTEAQRLSGELGKRLEEARRAVSEASEQRVAAASGRKAAEKALQAAQKELADAEAALVRALAEAGFADADSCRGALRDTGRREKLERGLADFDRETTEAATELKRCETAAKGVVAPDLLALRAAHQAADAGRSERVGEHARLEERLRSARQALGQLQKLGAERLVLEERFGVVGRVASLATGSNDLNLSLHRFVLGALLDEVLDVASVRLAKMSRGRYTLRRAGGLRDGRRAAGLDLEVDDTYSGQARPVATLSGGESFLAALALALSLAQVVQQHAGGLRLDALFIDEGFGSLDGDALDRAISMLERLGAEGGRLVGVISHVGELAQRIPTRLKVSADVRGSSAELILG